ncbi:MAG: TPR repeat-containing protein [Stygiobacter sp.]|nr:MAG: TPR repeat-containing protein [Stygiobacter sp.]
MEASVSEDLFQQAVGLVQSGRLAEAGGVLTDLLAVAPGHAEAARLAVKLRLLDGSATAADLEHLAAAHPDHPEIGFEAGVGWLQAGDQRHAIACFRRHLQHFPDHSGTLFNLAWALRRQGADSEAEALLRRLLVLVPGHGAGWFNLGTLLADHGDHAGAATAFETSLRCGFDAKPATIGLALATLRQGRVDAAEAMLGALSPAIGQEAPVLALRAEIAVARGDDRGGLTLYDQATALAPDQLPLRLGRLRLQRRLGQARSVFDETVTELDRPQAAVGVLLELCAAAQVLRRLDMAEAAARRAVDLAADDPTAINALAKSLAMRGRNAEAVACFRMALALAPDNAALHSNLIYAMVHDEAGSPPQLFAEAQNFGRYWEKRLSPLPPPPPLPDDDRRMVRIGYVSADFCDHAVAYLIEPLLRRHDHERFHVTCYHVARSSDHVTDRLRGLVPRWRVLPCDSADFTAMAATIRADGIDILVDLSGHTAGNVLPMFALRPAPVQVSAIGYPGTTGLGRMDYRLVYGGSPKGGDDPAFSSETLLPFPAFLPFQAPAAAVPVGPPPVLERGYVTFAALNKFAKASVGARRAWARILAALPPARLVVLAPPAQAESIRAGFVADGARAEQVEVIEELALDGWLALMEDVDIALDSFPYRGGTTAMMSDWRGVPLVALLPEGQGKDDDRRLYCRDEDEYVATAVALAGDPDQLVERRAELPLIARLDEAANADLAIRALERLFREIWATYLERRSRA